MKAVVRGQNDAVGGVAAGVIRDGSAIARQDQTDLLVDSSQELLCIAERSEEALIICPSQQVNLFGLRREAGCQICPTAVSVAGS